MCSYSDRLNKEINSGRIAASLVVWHLMGVDWGNEWLSLEEAIQYEEKRISVDMKKLAAGDSFNYRHFSYLARSMYADQLERWFQYFPREQFLLIKSEELYAEPARIFQETLDFLYLPNDVKIVNRGYKQYNKQRYPVTQQMAPETRQRLVEIFMLPNERLYKLVGRNFGWQ